MEALNLQREYVNLLTLQVQYAGAMTIGGALAGRNNALNLIRFLLAVVVIYSHTFPLGGYSAEPRIGGETLGRVAVGGFFALSGYLIAGSRVRLSFPRYMWHRAIRILPAFWVCLIITAFVFAPTAAALFGQSWNPGGAIAYVLGNSLLYITQPGIVGSLGDAPFPNLWNGSLWTLFYEFSAYILAGVLLTAGFVRRHAVAVTGAILLALTAAQMLAKGPLEVTTNLYLHPLWLGSFFAAGMFVWSLREKLASSLWIATACTGVLVVICFVGQFTVLAPVFFAYLLLWIGGVVKTRVFSRNDVSYGVYIYSFPIQQLLTLAGAAAIFSPASYAIASLAGTLVLAWLSWKLVEQPAMSLKHCSPRFPALVRANP